MNKKNDNELSLNDTNIPSIFKASISSIEYEDLSENKPTITVKKVSDNMVKINLSFDLKDSLKKDDWKLTLTPTFTPSFHWSPHLTPTKNHVIDQHVFRSPAIVVSDEKQLLVMIPDLDLIPEGNSARWYMDMNAISNKLYLGLSKTKVKEHVLFVRDTGAVHQAGKLEIGFYLMAFDDAENISNPWRQALSFMWEKWGKQLYEEGYPLKTDPEKYVEYTYDWAFKNWKEAVWQEFSINGKKVGAPTFIVNYTQSPNYPQEHSEREFRSIWNQAWFSSLRSASGLYRYARRTKNADLLEKANLTKELALSFPQKNGFFYGVIGTEMEDKEIKGKKYRRSKGWETYQWGNSNRNPLHNWGSYLKAPFHILDMSWTAYLMLMWYEDLENDERLLTYSKKYGDALIKIQDKKGFFPGWLELETLKPLDVLNDSPETSMSVTFLIKLFNITKDKKYLEAAKRGMDAVTEDIIADGRWEDFETYWSCSRWGQDTLVGKKIKRNNMYKQNNFSMYWTAEALYHCYKTTNEKQYLNTGQRVLDELLMCQASWQPPYIYVNALGGFGVMNADGEWNDSRQSLFSELIIDYGKELNNQEYIERGIAALKSSFIMMYCPENKKEKTQWEKKYPFFNEKDYGFMMENYGHGGQTSPEGEGMGVFTIYDWGNGAAAEAYNRILDHHGNEFISN